MRRITLLLGLLAALLALTAAPALAAGPTATTTAPTSVGSTSATLNGSFSPGSDMLLPGAILCQFSYGTTSAYGQSASCTASASGGTVTAQVTGLTANTLYHYQLTVTFADLSSPGTTSASSADASFTTLTAANAQAPVPTTTAASNIFANTAQLNGTVVPGTDDLTDCHFKWGTSASALTNVARCETTPGAGTSAVPVDAVLGGLSAGTTYYYALVATSGVGSNAGSPLNFTTTSTAAPAPTATTTAATNVTDTGATVNGTVNPQGAGVINCVLQYGITTTYGHSAPCSPMPASGTSDEPVSAALTGLSTGTTYHFRVAFETGAGFAIGGDLTLTTTGPAVATGAASAVTGTTAILHGSVSPGGATLTGCTFYYGPTTAYGSSAPCAAGAQPAESAAISGLTPKTTYHFLVAATTSGGTTYGADATFTTLALPTGATTGASGVSSATATLHGLVNPHAAPVIACIFQYGVSPFGYGGRPPTGAAVPCSPAPRATAASQAVSVALHGLASRTAYYFRVVIETAGGFFVGQTRSFRTATVHEPGVKITRVSIRGGSVTVRFRATGVKATRYQCALAAVSRRGKLGKVRYASCRSPKTFTRVAKGRHELLVRASGGSGYGAPAKRKLTV